MTDWSFVLPGQPPSWNDSYRIVRQQGRRGPYMTLAKKQKVIDYQEMAVLLIRSARPRHWDPSGQVRLMYDFHLIRDIDCDNAMKAIHDALQMATGVDDKRFLPCVRSKELVNVSPRVEVLVEDLE